MPLYHQGKVYASPSPILINIHISWLPFCLLLLLQSSIHGYFNLIHLPKNTVREAVWEVQEDNRDPRLYSALHLSPMAQGPPFLERLLRGSSWGVCRTRMLCCSTILPDHSQIQTQPPEDSTYCSYAEVLLAPSLPQLPTACTKQSAALLCI